MPQSAHIFSCVHHGLGHHAENGRFVTVQGKSLGKKGVSFRGLALRQFFPAVAQVVVHGEFALQGGLIFLFIFLPLDGAVHFVQSGKQFAFRPRLVAALTTLGQQSGLPAPGRAARLAYPGLVLRVGHKIRHGGTKISAQVRRSGLPPQFPEGGNGQKQGALKVPAHATGLDAAQIFTDFACIHVHSRRIGVLRPARAAPERRAGHRLFRRPAGRP